MVISIFLPSIGASGGIDVIYKYAALLKARGHDVCVYKELRASNMHRFPSKIKNIVHQIYCSAKAIVKKNAYRHDIDRYVWTLSDNTVRDADIIIATAWPTAFRVAKLSEHKGKKFYFIQDYETWDNADLARKSYELPLRKIVISGWINDCLERDLGIGPFPVVHNGIDMDLYRSNGENPPESDASFLMLNHKLPKKGVQYGLKAFEIIKAKHPDCKLRMFGLCDGSGLPDYVEYYQNPTKEKLVELYSKSNFFIFPSLEEGWGLTPLEAMSCGCIVIGTNTGFVIDIGIDHKNILISEPKDVERMADNIEEVLHNPALCREMRKNAFDLVHTLNWNKSADELERYLTQG